MSKPSATAQPAPRHTPTWNPNGWKFLGSTGCIEPDGRFLVYAKFGRSFEPPQYEAGYGPEMFNEQRVTYYLRDTPAVRSYDSHVFWLAIREIHLSGLEPRAFEGRELPTISEEAAQA